MFDPIGDVFGVSARELFASPELLLRHGPLERFPSFMRQGPMESTESLCRAYVGAVEIANGTSADGVQLSIGGAHPAALLRLGLTVYFSDLKQTIPASENWLRQLEASLGLPQCASMMAFANAAGSGLSLHHDRFDQLFFQLRGDKQFRYAPNGFVQNPDVQFSPFGAASPSWPQSYRAGFPSSSAEVLSKPFETAHLRPGSAFFMPAGTWHTTAEQTTDSLSLVVAVRAPSRLDLLENLLRYYVGQSPDWRARPYGGWSSDAALAAQEHAVLARLLVDLGTRLSSLPAAAAYPAWSAHGYTIGTQAAFPLDAHFARYIRLPNSSVRFETDGPEGKLRCTVSSGPTHRPQAQTVLAFNAEAKPVVDWILASHAAFAVDELQERFGAFARDELEGLLAWLSHAALIRPLPAPEWDAPASPSARD